MNLPLLRSATLRELSAFYTPPSTAAALAQWVVRTGTESILEPSFGGGALIEAAISQAMSLSECARPTITGIDIDPTAIDGFSDSALPGRVTVRQADFLELAPEQLGKFDAILSNPPFTRNHAIPAAKRGKLRSKFEITGAAGLWVHFVLHSLSFLKPGGRIGFVIPSSGLFTTYGEHLLRRVMDQFRAVEVLRLNERPAWIGGAEEAGAFLLAEGFLEGSCTELARGFWIDGRGPVADFDSAGQVYSELMAASQDLGDIAQLSIGAVTGCNRTFLLSERERRELKIARADVTPIISRARHIKGVLVSKEELARLGASGERTWLLLPRGLGSRGSGVRSRLATVSRGRRRNTAWFQKRQPWWAVDPGANCDAVFSYMNDTGPRLAQTTPGITCTNTLHRVVYRPTVTEAGQHASVLTILSTFGQLAAERLGRVYGGGVLKLELKEARQLPVLPISPGLTSTVLARADELVRARKMTEAADLVDEVILPPLLGASWATAVLELRQELTERRRARRKTVATGIDPMRPATELYSVLPGEEK